MPITITRGGTVKLFCPTFVNAYNRFTESFQLTCSFDGNRAGGQGDGDKGAEEGVKGRGAG